MNTVAYLEARITATQGLIEAYETALTSLGTTQSFTLDTGQTRETVTKADIPRLNNMIDALYNRLATLQARLNGGNTIGLPAW